MLSSRSLTPKVLGAILGLTLLVAGCSRESEEAAQPTAASAGAIDRSHRGSAIPDLVFADTAGRELRLTALKGKPVLINLWATWCAPCVAEMPALERLAAARADNLKVLTVSQDMAQPEKVTAFFAERGLARLEPWLDPENELSTHYRAESLPMTIYYDAAGREVWRLVGPHEWGDAATAALLEEAE